MKNAEFASVRGVPAVVASLRTAGLLTASKRDFIWYLQGLSLQDGGFKRVARELVNMFPDRLRTRDMIKANVVCGKNYPGDLVEAVEYDLGMRCYLGRAARAFLSVGDSEEPELPEESEPDMPGSHLIECCRKAAYGLLNCQREPQSLTPSLEEFLVGLCTNPKWRFSLPGVAPEADELEMELTAESNPDLPFGPFNDASLSYFYDIIGALLEYRARQAKQTRENFHLTAIGKKIFETLDYSLASRNMVLVDGLEGRGKTEAVKAWCELHGGQARLVSLKGVATKTAIFREIAFALGITYAHNRTGPEMQSRIEDVLNRSKIMLVIDEAHFLFNQTTLMTARPEMIDWLDTAAANRGVPVALVTTPQFIACMARAKNQVEWNFNQFRRRVKRWVTLPRKNIESDIAAVARKVFHGASESVIKKVVGYALLTKRDLSAVGDVAAEIRAMLGTEDLGKATVEHVHRAITEFLIPSDQAFRVALDEAESAQRKSSRRPAPAMLPVLADDSEPLDVANPAPSSAAEHQPRMDRTRGGLPIPAQRLANPATIRGSVEAVLTAD